MSLKVDVKSIYHLVLERAGKPIGLLEEGSYISLGKLALIVSMAEPSLPLKFHFVYYCYVQFTE